MATVSVPEEGLVINTAEQIKKYLAGISIEYELWPLAELNTDADSADILRAYDTRIEELKEKGGYVNVDIIDVHPLTPGLDEMLAKFNREHWHDEDEVRFTLHGRGIFHIHPPNHPVVAIEVEAGDMIRVPKGTHHWFNLCGTKEIKAIRFFQDKSGWTPHYTGANEADKYEPVCFGPGYFPYSRSQAS